MPVSGPMLPVTSGKVNEKSSPKSLLGDCRYTVGQLLPDGIPTVNQQLTNSKPTLKKLRSVMTSPSFVLTVLLESVALSTTNCAKIMHHRMSWISLSLKSPCNALRFILASHMSTFNYLCLFEFIFG